MKFDFSFETIRKDSALPDNFLDKLTEDISFLQKTAETPKVAFIREMLPHLGLALGASAVAGTYGYLTAKKKYGLHQKNLESSFKALHSSNPEFSENPSQFQQRFMELSLISPTVAANPNLAHKILKSKLDAGFDLNDVHQLTAIQHHLTSTPGIESPSAKGLAEAASTFWDWSRLVAPAALTESVLARSVEGLNEKAKSGIRDELRNISAKDKEKLMAIAKKLKSGEPPGGPMGKEGSENMDLIVSEECLGRMLADRYCMMKTAGVISSAAAGMRDMLSASGNHIKDYMKVMALPLAIGGGIKIVSDLMKQKASAQLHAQADQIFNQMRRTNSYVKENPELASEAFDTLRTFAPALAAKPLVAKTFVEHVITSDGRIPPDTTKMLSETQTLVNKLNDATDGGFIKGLQNPMSLFKHTISRGKGKDEE